MKAAVSTSSTCIQCEIMGFARRGNKVTCRRHVVVFDMCGSGLFRMEVHEI